MMVGAVGSCPYNRPDLVAAAGPRSGLGWVSPSGNLHLAWTGVHVHRSAMTSPGNGSHTPERLGSRRPGSPDAEPLRIPHDSHLAKGLFHAFDGHPARHDRHVR